MRLGTDGRSKKAEDQYGALGRDVELEPLNTRRVQLFSCRGEKEVSDSGLKRIVACANWCRVCITRAGFAIVSSTQHCTVQLAGKVGRDWRFIDERDSARSPIYGLQILLERN
jgi:hypothetical protein